MRLIVLIYFTFLNILFSQQIVYELKLPKYLDETSALEYYGGNLLTLNDSGGKSILYEFNFDGVVINQHQIKTVKNYDWESLAADNNFIYVGDFGNNFSNRDNLTILKINIKNFELVGKILISYKNQKKTLYNPLGKFDAEALISYDNKLILFSKNRKDLTSEVYIIPKEIGTYKLEEINSIITDCLITGADYDNDLNKRINTRYFPTSPLQPNFSPIPSATIKSPCSSSDHTASSLFSRPPTSVRCSDCNFILHSVFYILI